MSFAEQSFEVEEILNKRVKNEKVVFVLVFCSIFCKTHKFNGKMVLISWEKKLLRLQFDTKHTILICMRSTALESNAQKLRMILIKN